MRAFADVSHVENISWRLGQGIYVRALAEPTGDGRRTFLILRGGDAADSTNEGNEALRQLRDAARCTREALILRDRDGAPNARVLELLAAGGCPAIEPGGTR